jgi:hypothetical protein
VEASPESLAIRTQYENWARDRSITMWTWTSIVGQDLKRAADVVLYHQECAPVQADKLRRAQAVLDAFPDWKWSEPKETARWEFNTMGRDKWCRATNPTPLPAF